MFATRHCAPAYNACCINQTTDTWRVLLPQQQLFINVSQLCNGRSDCTLRVDKETVTSPARQMLSDYVIIGFDCITNHSGTSPPCTTSCFTTRQRLSYDDCPEDG